MHRIFAGAALYLFAATASADTITSTPAGGLWADGATWAGGVVPGDDDDVIVVGPVQVTGAQGSASLDVSGTGLLTTSATGPARLDVGGSVTNSGTIQDFFRLTLTVGGDLAHHGVSTNHETLFTGALDHHVTATTDFASNLSFDVDAIGDVVVGTPFRTLADIALGEGRMVLGADCPLTLGQSRFSGTLAGNDNELRFESWSYLDQCTIANTVLVGAVSVAHGVRFEGTVTIMDTLRNLASAGGSMITVDGDLINRGDIERTDYSFVIFLSGSLENDGTIAISQIEMDDATPHRVRMGPDGKLDANVFLPEFGNGTLITETDVHFAEGVSLGIDGTMILAPATTVRLTEWGSIGGGTLMANGSTILMEGNGALLPGTIDQAVLDGSVDILGSISFTGGLTVSGVLQSSLGNDAEITIDGTLLNEGDVRDDGAALTITASGDVLNRGTLSNARVTLVGEVDQRVETGLGIDVPEFVLDSGLAATTYQWFVDGASLVGETLSTLTFATLGAAEHGVYHCEGNGGETSRLFVISEGISVDVPPIVPHALAVLEPARPNPFRPATEIGFVLAKPSSVRLAVYDVVGREVSVLVDGRLDAGRHHVGWQPTGAAPGVYFFRLSTGGASESVQRAVLVD